MLQVFQKPGDSIIFLKDHNGPMVMLRGRYGPGEVRLAGALAVRYGDVPDKMGAEVVVTRKGGIPYCMTVDGAREEEYLPLRVAATN